MSASARNLHSSDNVKSFQQHARYALTDIEREKLYAALKHYQKYQKVEKLVQSLKLILNTPEKRDLIPRIRELIPHSHLNQFDDHMAQLKLVSQSPGALLYRSSEMTTSSRGSHGRPRSLSQPLTMKNHRLKHHSRLGENHRSRLHPQKVLIPVLKQEVEDVRLITIHRSHEESLGFSIRGGIEHGLGIYVSELDEGSVADLSGLEAGDQILEVNSTSLDGIPSSSAVKLLTDSPRLKLVIKRTGKVPGWRYSYEQTSWFDTEKKRIITGQVQDNIKHVPSSFGPFLNGIAERRVNLSVRKRDQHTGLGFNIRGGSEYGLGIFVSSIDKGGLAQQKGVRVGDKILSVNGASFESMTHAAAVDFLKAQTQLILTVRDVGRFPVFKELHAEYAWLDGRGGQRSRPQSQAMSYNGLHIGRLTRIPHESKIDIFTQTDEDDSSQLSLNIHTEEVLPLQTEIYMPGNSQFLLRETEVENRLNGSASDMEDLLLEHFERRHSYHDNNDLDVFLASTSALNREEPRDFKAQLDSYKIQDNQNSPPEHGRKRSRSLKQKIVGSLQSMSSSTSSRKGKNKAGSHRKKSSKAEDNHDSASMYTGSVRKRGVFEKSFGSQIMHHKSGGGSSVLRIEDRARNILTEDEANAVLRHLRTYQETSDIERLVQVLLVILDKPDKVLFLKDIRLVIGPTDIGRFDSMVSRYEAQAQAELSANSSNRSPIRNVLNGRPQRRTLMDPVTDMRGSFHLETHNAVITQKYRGRASISEQDPAGNSSGEEYPDGTSSPIVTPANPSRPSDIIYQSPARNASSQPGVYSHHQTRYSSLSSDKGDAVSITSYGSSVSSVDSAPVALDDFEMPPAYIRPTRDRKVEVKSYELVRSDSDTNVTNDGLPSLQHHVSPRREIPSEGSVSMAISENIIHKGSADEQHSPLSSSDNRDNSRPSSAGRSQSPIRYVTAVTPSGTLRQNELSVSDPPPPLLISTMMPSKAQPSREELSPFSPPPMFTDDEEEATQLVQLSKAMNTLGLSISGGRESKSQPDVRVERVFPGGSAAESGVLQAGMLMVSIDGESLKGATHPQAVDIIRKSWNNKLKPTMDVVVKIAG